MKLEFQAKFLQHLNKRKEQDEGFTLIELLVVIIIIGILAAIALPSLLSQVNKGKQAEAKQNVGAINRAQQAYFLENDHFAPDVPSVGIGIKTQTVNYYYSITGDDASTPKTVNNMGLANSGANTIKSYLGQNFTTIGDTQTSEVLTLGFVCESNAIGTQGAAVVSGAQLITTTDVTGCDATNFKDLGGTKKGV
jgi:type IV pilus assembly protein PilA